MRTIYIQQLELLDTMVVKMGNDIKKQVEKSVVVLKEHNLDLAKEIMEYDHEINRQEKEIQDLCILLILKQQPVAKDLKQISSILKMITDMERIGDHASDISKMVLQMKHKVHDKCKVHLERMAYSTIYMLEQWLVAFQKKDTLLANQIWSYDDVVDELYEVVKKECVEAIQEDVHCADEILSTLLIAKYFEKMGDHMENIVEWMLYSLQ